MSQNDVDSKQSLIQSQVQNDQSPENKPSSSSDIIEMKVDKKDSNNPDDNNQDVNPSSYTNELVALKLERRRRLSTLIIIGIVSFLTGVDYAIILPTAWGYIQTFSKAQNKGMVMGGLLSGFAFAGVIAGLIFGHLSDVGFSLKKLVLVGVGFKIIGNVLYFIGMDYRVIIVGRVLAGVGIGLVPPILAEISRRSTPETRTQLLAKILAGRQIGLFIGPCFTLAFKQIDFYMGELHVSLHNFPGMFMAILWIIIWILTLFLFFDAGKAAVANKSFLDGWNKEALTLAWTTVKRAFLQPVNVVLMATSFIAYFNQTALETSITPFTNIQFGWHELQVSIVFAVAGVEITLVYIALHFVTKKIKDHAILLFAYSTLSIACIIGVIVLPFAKVGSTKYLPVFLIFIALDIFALPLIAVTSTSLFTQQMSYEQQGVGQGIQRLFVNSATVIGPLFAGALIRAAWIMISILMLMALVAVFLVILVYPKFESSTDDDELSTLLSSENKNKD